MSRWGPLSAGPIVTRLVLRVAAAMTVVLLAAGAFVFWRVQYALNRQLDQDLQAYQQVVERAVASGARAPGNTPGQSYQVYDGQGRVVAGNATSRLVDRAAVDNAAAGEEHSEDIGSLIPAAPHPYRVVTAVVAAPEGRVVVAAAISRAKHDEALRELLLQLLIADLVTLAAASLVGYATARGALDPVERYRLAAAQAGAEGAPQVRITTARDDELTRLVHTFNDLLERVGRATERERQFLADASHELRSPLALMHTELEWALMRPQPDRETRTALESLRDQVQRLIALSNALLDLEEVRGPTQSHAEPIRLAGLAEQVSADLAVEATRQHRMIRCDIPGDLTVHANRHWLELAVRNLVTNALRHGEGTVCISAATAGGGVRLTVADQGPGFPEDFVDHAFDRFSRADHSRSSGGTGLGLALVQAVAEARGGRADACGATVTLELLATPIGQVLELAERSALRLLGGEHRVADEASGTDDACIVAELAEDDGEVTGGQRQ